MNNPYQLILNNQPLEEVMRLAVKSNEAQLQTMIRALKGNEVVRIGSWTFDHLRSRAVHAVLDRGCLFYLYQLVTDDHDNRELFYGLIKEMGISRTQAYREIQVWKRFAAELIEKPELIQSFVPEALKILAQDSTPQSARMSAMELAHQGHGIDIRQAKQLIRVHRSRERGQSEGEAAENKRTTRASSRRPVTQAKGFIQKVIKLVRRPKKPLQPNDVDAIIQELEKAIKQIRHSEANQPATH